MERGSLVKWLFFGLAVFLFLTFGKNFFFGGGADEKQPLGKVDTVEPATRAPEQLCHIDGPRFSADLSTQGATLRHFKLTDAKYHVTGGKEPIDMVTTAPSDGSAVASRMPLRTDLRLPEEGPQQVAYSDFDWQLAAQDGTSCTFSYADDSVSLTKVIKATERPFELAVELKVENRASEPRKHRLAIEQTSRRTQKETEGHIGTMSEYLTGTVTKTAEKTERHGPGEFEPEDFKDKEFTPEKWRRTPGEGVWAATASSYFASVVIRTEGAPFAESQIEEYWDSARYPKKSDDPGFKHVYRARLAYPEKELAPKESATYKELAFLGPKERDVLAHVGGGGFGASDVIDLGWFAVIGKVLISYIYFLYRLVGSWGWAICLLTITVKTALFPLQLASIKSGIAMRKLKPEMDVINEKYKDDVAQRGLAMQELWRKHGVSSPVTGCIPVMLQMPVWFALYTALQTAVELYHTPFGPFIPDLSSKGEYYIIPIVLGASSFVQQKIMPPQGDPMQQKMMMYMMPAIFTFMMLFLPAGLGVYMLTNTWLGIAQQLMVERYAKRTNGGTPGGITVREKKTPDDDDPSARRAEASAPELGKGKARVRG